jgi:predicted dehydrogenase
MAETNYEIDSGETGSRVAAPALSYRPPKPKNYHPQIGLIGCGGISETHLKAYSGAGLNLVALCDMNLARAKERQSAFFPGAKLFSDFRELLDLQDIEVVDITTHPEERVEIIECALTKGKHVLSQKPFVTDLDTGERLVALAEDVNRKLAVNQNGRWSPHFSYIRHAIEAGLVGEVIGAHLGVHWNHDWVAGTPFNDVHHVVLYDFAIHWFDIVSCFMGSKTASRVFASTSYAVGQTAKPPLLGQVMVEYSGAQASLQFDAFTKYGSQDTTIVVGTQGTLLSTGPDLGHQTVTLTNAEGVSNPDLEGSWFPDGFIGSMGELLCAIEEDRPPSNSAQNNLHSLELCFAAIKSADTGIPQLPGSVRRLPTGAI